MKKFLAKIVLLCVLMPLTSFSQNYDYGFVRDFSVPVYDSSSALLAKAWVGGLNSCTFNSIDLNFDGTKDLVVFDKAGDRLLTFINNGTAGTVDYTYAPRYQKRFPKFTGWIQLKDYNCDGKEDIFAYTVAGIQVWRNVSDTALKFIMVSPLLNSFQGSGYSNIPLTYVDNPGIDDVDGDGDLDILVFFGLGAYVNFHQNMSMELYGNCDSLAFVRTFNCWGNFAESSSSNHIFLHITCPWKCHEFPGNPDAADKGSKHTGSTMLLLDMNNDGLKELVLGDVDFMNLTLLTNAGTIVTADMASADTLFPSNTVPVHLVSFPASSYMDVNNDGKKDLLVSPFDPNPLIPESFKSIWYYKNNGANSQPDFQYQMNNFLQREMIDVGTGGYPVFFDENADGLQDLIVADYGYLDSTYYQTGFLKSVFISKLALYRNTGTSSNPAFTLITRDFTNVSSLHLQSVFPAFGDLDDDGDLDMVCGAADGKLYYFTNTAGAGNPAIFTLTQPNYQGIDIGEFSAPALVDLDSDSLLDLAIGKKNGMLCWYKNTGTASAPVFTFVKDSLGGVNVTDYSVSYSGYATPCFFRDSTGLLKLFVGSDQGRIHFYKDIESNLYGQFTSTDSIVAYIDEDSAVRYIFDGIRTSAAIADLDGDGYMDLLTGNLAGGLTYYKGAVPKPYNSVHEYAEQHENVFSVFPNPASDKLYITSSEIVQDLHFNFQLFDLAGKLMTGKQISPDPSACIDVTGISPGVYVYHIVAANGKSNGFAGQTGKVVIIR